MARLLTNMTTHVQFPWWHHWLSTGSTFAVPCHKEIIGKFAKSVRVSLWVSDRDQAAVKQYALEGMLAFLAKIVMLQARIQAGQAWSLRLH